MLSLREFNTQYHQTTMPTPYSLSIVKIKICGLFREEDIDYVNEARPDYCGFVFAQSKRQVSIEQATHLRRRLADGIVPVGVFIDAPIDDIVALYRNGVINIAQLHGSEDEEYIVRLKVKSRNTPIPVVKVIKSEDIRNLARERGGTGEHGERKENKTMEEHGGLINSSADYYLFDSGAGSGKTFNWDLLSSSYSLLSPSSFLFEKPWFLAGGIGMDNIEQAMALNPFGIDVSSGAETDGVKDREKILRLTKIVREGNKG